VGTAAGVEPPYGAWQAPLEQDHPLTGRIRDVRGDRFIEPSELTARLAGARYVLLGEKHDNPDHHRLQAYLLRALITAGRRPAVAFEMFDADQAPTIERHLAAHPTDATGLADAVNWKASGWPDWAMYQPIVDTALGAGRPIVAANLSRDTLTLLRRGGALDPALAARWRLNEAPTAEVRESLAREIRDAHCGHGSDAMVDRMVAIQRARDASMAAAMADASVDGAVLIAGAGHTRTDRGVPAALRARAPASSIASVAFVEVAPDGTTPEAYTARYGAASTPFDYVWYTPRVDSVDPCGKFKKSLEGIRQRQ
jgi:uncharacterized iron-regulated protein